MAFRYCPSVGIYTSHQDLRSTLNSKGRTVKPPNYLLGQSETQNRREQIDENKVTSGKEIKNCKQLDLLLQNTKLWAPCIFSTRIFILKMLLESLILDNLKSSVGMSPICRLSEDSICSVFSSSGFFTKDCKRAPKERAGLQTLTLQWSYKYILYVFLASCFPMFCTICRGCHISPRRILNQTSSARQVEKWRWKAQRKINKV